MPLRFANQSTSYIIGDADTAATLTAAYSGNQVSFPTPEFDRAVLYVTYVPGASTRNLSIQMDGSPDGTNYFPKTALLEGDESGSSTLLDHVGVLAGTTGGTTYKKRWEIPISDKFVRVSVKEDGVSSFGTVKVQIILRYLK